MLHTWLPLRQGRRLCVGDPRRHTALARAASRRRPSLLTGWGARHHRSLCRRASGQCHRTHRLIPTARGGCSRRRRPRGIHRAARLCWEGGRRPKCSRPARGTRRRAACPAGGAGVCHRRRCSRWVGAGTRHRATLALWGLCLWHSACPAGGCRHRAARLAGGACHRRRRWGSRRAWMSGTRLAVRARLAPPAGRCFWAPRPLLLVGLRLLQELVQRNPRDPLGQLRPAQGPSRIRAEHEPAVGPPPRELEAQQQAIQTPAKGFRPRPLPAASACAAVLEVRAVQQPQGADPHPDSRRAVRECTNVACLELRGQVRHEVADRLGDPLQNDLFVAAH